MPETFLTPLFYSEKCCDLSAETKFEIKVLPTLKVRHESIFQLLTFKLGGCTLKGPFSDKHQDIGSLSGHFSIAVENIFEIINFIS